MRAQYTSQCCLCQMRCFTIMGDHHLCCFMLVSCFFFFFFFLMLHLFFFGFTLCHVNLCSSPTRYQTHAPCNGSTVLTTGLPGKFVFGTFVKHLVSSLGFPHSSVGKESACNAGDPGSIPWLERSAGEEIGYPLQDSWASFNGLAGKEATCNAGDLGLIPELGRSPGEGKGYPLQYSGLENSMDCTVCGVTKSWIQLSNFHSLLSSKTP